MLETLIDYLSEGSRALAVIALCSLVVSCLAVAWMARSLDLQMKHQRLRVRPACWISMTDTDAHLKISILNNGIGPMVIGEVVVSEGKEKRPNLIDWMPPGIIWQTYVSSFAERSLPASRELTVLELKGDPADARFRIQRDSVRSKLSRLSIAVRYRDAYGKRMPWFRRDLRWFGRNHDRIG